MQKGEDNSLALAADSIRSRIYTIRDRQVMLDSDLAELYDVEITALNQAVKRNIERFPEKFMFQISQKEPDNLKSQIVISSWGGRRTLPYAFTEQGVAMLSGILKSDIAIRVSIQIMSAFVAMRRFISANVQVFHGLDFVEMLRNFGGRNFWHAQEHAQRFLTRNKLSMTGS